MGGSSCKLDVHKRESSSWPRHKMVRQWQSHQANGRIFCSTKSLRNRLDTIVSETSTMSAELEQTWHRPSSASSHVRFGVSQNDLGAHHPSVPLSQWRLIKKKVILLLLDVTPRWPNPNKTLKEDERNLYCSHCSHTICSFLWKRLALWWSVDQLRAFEGLKLTNVWPSVQSCHGLYHRRWGSWTRSLGSNGLGTDPIRHWFISEWSKSPSHMIFGVESLDKGLSLSSRSIGAQSRVQIKWKGQKPVS